MAMTEGNSRRANTFESAYWREYTVPAKHIHLEHLLKGRKVERGLLLGVDNLSCMQGSGRVHAGSYDFAKARLRQVERCCDVCLRGDVCAAANH